MTLAMMRETLLAGFPSLAGKLYRVSLREAYELMRSKNRRDKEAWQRVALVAAYVHNAGFGAKKAVSPQKIVPFAFDTTGPLVQQQEEIEEMIRRSKARAERELRARRN